MILYSSLVDIDLFTCNTVHIIMLTPIEKFKVAILPLGGAHRYPQGHKIANLGYPYWHKIGTLSVLAYVTMCTVVNWSAPSGNSTPE